MIFSFRGVASDSRYVRTKEIDILGLYSKLKITITKRRSDFARASAR